MYGDSYRVDLRLVPLGQIPKTTSGYRPDCIVSRQCYLGCGNSSRSGSLRENCPHGDTSEMDSWAKKQIPPLRWSCRRRSLDPAGCHASRGSCTAAAAGSLSVDAIVMAQFAARVRLWIRILRRIALTLTMRRSACEGKC